MLVGNVVAGPDQIDPYSEADEYPLDQDNQDIRYTAHDLKRHVRIERHIRERLLEPPHVGGDLKEAARLDGASEYQIYAMVVPLVRPALGAIGIFTMIPIWNDLWFPLILAPSSKTATITLGVQQFLGQFVSDWNAVLSSLTLAMIPILIFYLIFSQQMIRSITAGAVK